MVEERQLGDQERLQSGQALQHVADPFSLGALVDLRLGRRQMQGVRQLADVEARDGKCTLEAGQSNCSRAISLARDGGDGAQGAVLPYTRSPK